MAGDEYPVHVRRKGSCERVVSQGVEPVRADRHRRSEVVGFSGEPPERFGVGKVLAALVVDRHDRRLQAYPAVNVTLRWFERNAVQSRIGDRYFVLAT